MNHYKDFFSSIDITRSEDLNTDNYYQIEIVKKIISKKLDIELYSSSDYYFHKNERLLELYFDSLINKKNIDVVKNGFYKLSTSIDLYRAYFNDFTENRYVKKNEEIIELTAYGKSNTQNRRVIAFRGKFKNGLLQSFEDLKDQCEIQSYSYSTPDNEKKYSIVRKTGVFSKKYAYKISAISFLEKMTENELDLLSDEKITIIYNTWTTSLLDFIIDYINNKKFIKHELKWKWEPAPILKYIANPRKRKFDESFDKSKGILLGVDDKDLMSNFNNYSSVSSEDSHNIKTPFNLEVDDIIFERDYIEVDGFTEKKKKEEVFYFTDFIEKLIKEYKNSVIYSENLKLKNKKIYSILDFSQEKQIFEKLEELKKIVILYTENEFFPNYLEYENQEKKNQKYSAIGCLGIIIILIILFRSCS